MYPSIQSAYPTVCVKSQPAKGTSAPQFIGKASHQSSLFPASVMRQVLRQSELSSVAFAFSQGAEPGPSREATPKDMLQRMSRKFRQAASSSVFESMRRRIAISETS